MWWRHVIVVLHLWPVIISNHKSSLLRKKMYIRVVFGKSKPICTEKYSCVILKGAMYKLQPKPIIHFVYSHNKPQLWLCWFNMSTDLRNLMTKIWFDSYVAVMLNTLQFTAFFKDKIYLLGLKKAGLKFVMIFLLILTFRIPFYKTVVNKKLPSGLHPWHNCGFHIGGRMREMREEGRLNRFMLCDKTIKHSSRPIRYPFLFLPFRDVMEKSLPITIFIKMIKMINQCVFFVVSLDKLLSNQSSCCRFETFWRPCDITSLA